MGVFNFVRRSFYRDSVALMRLSRDLEAVPGVATAAAMMGTAANRALLREAGLLASEGDAAEPMDLIVAVVADSPDAASVARETVERALLAPSASAAGGDGAARPRTLASGLRSLPGANLALISVPGAYAAAEAMKALRAGLHVMLFSDNVPLAAEVELKRTALARGRCCSGPTAGPPSWTACRSGSPTRCRVAASAWRPPPARGCRK
jgi:FdrA protein